MRAAIDIPVARRDMGLNEDGDVYYEDTSPRGVTRLGTVRVGDTGGKTPITHHGVQHFEASAIPPGATILGAKLSIRNEIAQVLDPGTIAKWKIEALRATSEYNSISRELVVRSTASRFTGRVRQASPIVELSSSNDSTASDDSIDFYLDFRNGITSGNYQIFTIDTAGTLDTVACQVNRTNNIGTGIFLMQVWPTTGGPGNYRIPPGGVALGSTVDITFGLIPAAPAVGTYVRALTNGGFTVKVGEVYALLCALIPLGGGPHADAVIHQRMKSSLDGSRDNMGVIGRAGQGLQGFGENTNFISAHEIHVAPTVGSAVTHAMTTPAWGAGSLVSFGEDLEFSTPTVSLPGLRALVQAAFDDQDAGFMGLRVTAVDHADAEETRWHSSRAVTATFDSLKGMVLTVEYDGGVCARGIDVVSAAQHEGLVAQSAALHRGASVAAAVELEELEAEPAVAAGEGQVLAAVENEGAEGVGSVDLISLLAVRGVAHEGASTAGTVESYGTEALAGVAQEGVSTAGAVERTGTEVASAVEAQGTQVGDCDAD